MAHILIADDDELIAEMAADALLAAGHACDWVTDGTKVLDLFRWRRPDLLLLDQDMPGLTGKQVLRELRGSEQHYDLPVVMFTAITGAYDEQSALYGGAQGYIRKPFLDKFLVRTVELVLAAREGRPGHRDLREALGYGVRETNAVRRTI